MQTITARVADAVHHIARCEHRLRARLTTRLEIDGDGGDAAFTLRNVSASGFMGECDEPVRSGSRVALLLPFGGRVEADVRWALNGRIGCRIDGRLGPRQRALVLALTLKNGLLSWTALQLLIVAALVAVLALH
jgi:hypothetical protein